MIKRKLDKPAWVAKTKPDERLRISRLWPANRDRQNLLVSSILSVCAIAVSVGIGTYQNALTREQISAGLQIEDSRLRVESIKNFSRAHATFAIEANEANVVVGYLERCVSGPRPCTEKRVQRLLRELDEHAQALFGHAEEVARARAEASLFWTQLPRLGSDFSAVSYASHIESISDELRDANLANADDLSDLANTDLFFRNELSYEKTFEEMEEYHLRYEKDFSIMSSWKPPKG